jgi:hypothetical protein
MICGHKTRILKLCGRNPSADFVSFDFSTIDFPLRTFAPSAVKIFGFVPNRVYQFYLSRLAVDQR